jgi:hypothetical protein
MAVEKSTPSKSTKRLLSFQMFSQKTGGELQFEQVAFCAAHVVPGLDFSNDPLLAGRTHSYQDTQTP